MTTTDDHETSAVSVIERSRALEAAGEWQAAIDLLTDAQRSRPDPALDNRLVQVRHSAFAQLDVGELDEAWPPPVPDRFADREPGTLPEIAAHELTAELLASALAHHGSLIVRGLLSADLAESLLADTKRGVRCVAGVGRRRAGGGDRAPGSVPSSPTRVTRSASSSSTRREPVGVCCWPSRPAPCAG